MSEEIEKCVADLKEKYQAIPEEKRQTLCRTYAKEKFLTLQKIELIKGRTSSFRSTTRSIGTLRTQF